jgi:hypothetical protein
MIVGFVSVNPVSTREALADVSVTSYNKARIAGFAAVQNAHTGGLSAFI